MSTQVFEDVRKLVESYRLDTIAQSLVPEQKIEFETEDEEIGCVIEEFLKMVEGFLKHKKEFSTDRGKSMWLDWIFGMLGLEAKLIRTVGEKTYSSYDKNTQWYIEFAVDSLVEIIQRTRKKIRIEAILLRNSRKDYASLRQSVICILSNLTYSLFTVIFAIIKVDKKELKPQGLYEVVSDALKHTEYLT